MGLITKNGKNELSDNHLVNVCFQSNIIDMSFGTWLLDDSATIHACKFYASGDKQKKSN